MGFWHAEVRVLDKASELACRLLTLFPIGPDLVQTSRHHTFSLDFAVTNFGVQSRQGDGHVDLSWVHGAA